MRLGLQIPNLTLPGGPARLGANLRDIARHAEQAGLYSVWVMDHFFQIEFVGPAEMDMLEGYSTLSFLAAHTERVKLGTMVTGITYRQPGVLAKTATTLDVLSGGRAYFGVGAAWFEREHMGLGVPYPPVAERFERLEETIQIALQMWSPNNGAYHGQHYRLEETLCVPQPLSQPHPPILIGGMGEQKTLRMVAQYAQACNLFAFAGRETLERKLEVLRGHCEVLGRDYDEIEKTTLEMARLSRDGENDSMTPDQWLKHLQSLADIGVSHALFSLPNPTDPAVWELIANQVVPRASQIEARRGASAGRA